jgi:hypothetical protein
MTSFTSSDSSYIDVAVVLLDDDEAHSYRVSPQ